MGFVSVIGARYLTDNPIKEAIRIVNVVDEDDVVSNEVHDGFRHHPNGDVDEQLGRIVYSDRIGISN